MWDLWVKSKDVTEYINDRQGWLDGQDLMAFQQKLGHIMPLKWYGIRICRSFAIYNDNIIHPQIHNIQDRKTRSTGTVYTSTKASLTSVVIRIWIHDPDHHQNLIICSMAHCQPSLKISCKSIQKFLRKVANRQTDKQQRLDYISSLAEVKNFNSYNVLTYLTVQAGRFIWEERASGGRHAIPCHHHYSNWCRTPADRHQHLRVHSEWSELAESHLPTRQCCNQQHTPVQKTVQYYASTWHSWGGSSVSVKYWFKTQHYSTHQYT